jgi:hypothetical protein
MWEPNDKESIEVLNALYRHEPSSVDRRDFSRPHRWLTRFDLGAGGRRFESGHPDQPKALPILARPHTHLALNAATAVVFAIGYSWRAGDHVALDKDEIGPARAERSRRGVPDRRHVAGRQAHLPLRQAGHEASRS